MAIEEFRMAGLPFPQPSPSSVLLIEWDGTNQDDVIAFLNGIEEEWNQEEWTYSILNDQLIVIGSRSGPQQPMDAYAWFRLEGGSGGINRLYIIPPEYHLGMIKTKDPFGRPPSIDYLIGPVDGSWEHPEGPPPSGPEQH
jgi:hypothetical protein